MKKQIESGWAIPDDWDGESWTCYAIQWPDSPKYKLLLRSLLYSLSRGRDWDKQTGTITLATLIGWEIFDRNSPLIDCADSSECPECPECEECPDLSSGACGGGLIVEESEMGQVVTDVTVENGVLTVWFGPCCSKPLTDFISGQTGQDLGDDPLNTDDDPDFEYSACGKANAIVETVYKIVEAGWNELDTVPFFWEIIPNIESYVGYDLDNNWLIDMMSNIGASSLGGYSWGDFNDATDKQRILCKIVQFFADDAEGVPTSAKFEAIKAAFYAETLSVLEPTAALMFQSAVNALGRVDMDTVAKLGASDLDTDCSCPAAEPFQGLGTELDWRYVYDFRTGLHGWTIDADDHQDSTGLWSDNQITDHKAQIAATKALDDNDNGSTILLVAVMWQTIGDEAWLISGTSIGTDEGTLIGEAQIVAVCGNNPSAAGTWTYAAAVDTAIDTDFAEFAAGLQAAHDTAVSQRLVAVMFAGSGPGPMSSPAG